MSSQPYSDEVERVKGVEDGQGSWRQRLSATMVGLRRCTVRAMQLIEKRWMDHYADAFERVEDLEDPREIGDGNRSR